MLWIDRWRQAGVGLALAAAVIATVPCSAMADTPADSIDFRLEDHRWEHRLVLVFSPGPVDDRHTEQQKFLAGHEDGIADRDLRLVWVFTEGASRITRRAYGKGTYLTARSAERLRERFDVPADSFRVLLVGKDGTEKLRQPEPLTVKSLFQTIDAMPMRQREMREQGSTGEGRP
jgi:hypothetical protein